MAWYDTVLPESTAITWLAPRMAREAGSAQAVMARDESRSSAADEPVHRHGAFCDTHIISPFG
jgi:hypothetical protein